ncbi:PREDICTED: uncharacterized protein LOC109191854 [Ipomoea nil]|uniref:uncharacterized protein LOC109191854 n=1 Tax=Ipomoea nil TaxID=35883 RepID=UPI0009009F00|nr:PREDICTED: uncharacterized protein LOC109191854 [Ipomoea nil]
MGTCCIGGCRCCRCSGCCSGGTARSVSPAASRRRRILGLLTGTPSASFGSRRHWRASGAFWAPARPPGFSDFHREDLAVGEELVGGKGVVGGGGGGAEVEVEVDCGFEEEGIGGLELDGDDVVGILEIMGEGDSWARRGA